MANNTCIEPGCNQPRYKKNQRCQSHQRERWRMIAEQRRRAAGVEETKRSTRSPLAKCPLCHRTPRQASIAAAQGIICTGCNPVSISRQLNHLQTQVNKQRQRAEPVAATAEPLTDAQPVTAKIIATCFGEEEGLIVMEGLVVQRLQMPETERERRQIVADYARQGYLVVG